MQVQPVGSLKGVVVDANGSPVRKVSIEAFLGEMKPSVSTTDAKRLLLFQSGSRRSRLPEGNCTRL